MTHHIARSACSPDSSRVALRLSSCRSRSSRRTTQDELPEMGTAAQATLSLEDENRHRPHGHARAARTGRRARRPGGRRIPAVARPAALEPRAGRQSRLQLLHGPRPRDQRVCTARRLRRHALRAAARDEQRKRAGRRAGARSRARHAAAHCARHRGAVAHEPGIDGRGARGHPAGRAGGGSSNATMGAISAAQDSRRSRRSLSRAKTNTRPTASASACWRTLDSTRTRCRRSSTRCSAARSSGRTACRNCCARTRSRVRASPSRRTARCSTRRSSRTTASPTR